MLSPIWEKEMAVVNRGMVIQGFTVLSFKQVKIALA